MRVHRNDPCPCGSGKKYKACCMSAELAAERAGLTLAPGDVARARDAGRDAARAAGSWAVDVVPVEVVVSDRDAAPALGMVTADGFVVVGDLVARRPEGTAQRAEALAELVSAAGRRAGVLPGRVHVREAEVVEALSAALAGRGITVEAAPMPELDEALDGALEQLTGSPVAARMNSTESWAETGCTADELRDFHEAAARFYAAEPWNALTDMDPLLITLPDGTEWAASVMGGGGIEYGLALYSDPGDLLALLEALEPDPESMFMGIRGWTLTLGYEPRAGISRVMQREAARGRWPLAGPNAHPRLYGMKLPERRVTAAHVRFVGNALRAVEAFVRGADPEPATGLQVAAIVEEGGERPWPLPEHAGKMLAEGPGAQPVVDGWDMTPKGSLDVEQPRYERFQDWLHRRRKLPASAEKAAVRNGRCWGHYLVSLGLTAGAVTEYDLRVFLYRYYPLAANTTQAATRDLPRSLSLIFRFLETEGIRYPFADAVLAELGGVAGEAKRLGVPMEDLLRELSEVVWPDVDDRAMIPGTALSGTDRAWPGSAGGDAGKLRGELQRRWLVWYDEEVRGGNTDFAALREALLTRQRAWENAPHPRLAGRTPRQAVLEHLEREKDAPEPPAS